MRDIEKKLGQLIADQIYFRLRDNEGILSHYRVAQEYIRLVEAKSIEEMFQLDHQGLRSPWRERGYLVKELVASYQDMPLEKIFERRYSILVEAFEKSIRQITNSEIEFAKSQYELECTRKVAQLALAVEKGKHPDELAWYDKYLTRDNVPYLTTLVVVFVFLFLLVLKGLISSPTVNIEINLGEIIGGLLVGVGAAAAGISYAIKGNDKKNKNNHEY